ncbi:MAG: CBS domain-containing protein [Acidobacteria bacterium]|nr:CBS domain-containing protein [Acidobacteriota bacterium]
MSPRTIAELVRRDAPLIFQDQSVEAAVELLLGSDLPALPAVDDRQRFVGIFGEREFITALFPGYVGSLRHAAFVPKSIDAVLLKRQGCRAEPVSKHLNTEHVDVGPDFSDVGLAEIFLHHRVLIVPVTEQRRVVGLITRSDFFAALAERFLAHG